MEHSEKHARLFDRIAMPYAWFFAGQVRAYAEHFKNHGHLLAEPAGRTALDIGCGTGAFTTALRNAGWNVTGVDAAAGMVGQAARRGVRCINKNILAGLPFADASQDLVTAAYVAHGLRAADRAILFSEMKRISRGMVLLHDYGPERSLVTDVIEWVEGGDYFNFIRTGLEEMRMVFGQVRVVRVARQAAWYICS